MCLQSRSRGRVVVCVPFSGEVVTPNSWIQNHLYARAHTRRCKNLFKFARAIHLRAMSGSSSSSGDDSDGPMIRNVILRPDCRCRTHVLARLFWTSEEDVALCFECLNRVRLRDVSASERLCYLVLLKMWHGPRSIRRQFFWHRMDKEPLKKAEEQSR